MAGQVRETGKDPERWTQGLWLQEREEAGKANLQAADSWASALSPGEAPRTLSSVHASDNTEEGKEPGPGTRGPVSASQALPYSRYDPGQLTSCLWGSVPYGSQCEQEDK